MSEESDNKLYPALPPTDKEQGLLDKISRQRSEIIKSKVKELEDLAKHYEKVRRKWSKALTIIRVLGTGVGSVLAVGATIAASIASSGIAIPILIPAIVGGVGVIETSISEITALTLMKSKIKKYRMKKDIIEKYTNRLYHFYHLAIEDSKITPQEMEEFYKITDDYKKESNEFITEHERKRKREKRGIRYIQINT